MATLKQVNKHIQSKYPKIELVKGNGYFYVSSDDDEVGRKFTNFRDRGLFEWQ